MKSSPSWSQVDFFFLKASRLVLYNFLRFGYLWAAVWETWCHRALSKFVPNGDHWPVDNSVGRQRRSLKWMVGKLPRQRRQYVWNESLKWCEKYGNLMNENMGYLMKHTSIPLIWKDRGCHLVLQESLAELRGTGSSQINLEPNSGLKKSSFFCHVFFF